MNLLFCLFVCIIVHHREGDAGRVIAKDNEIDAQQDNNITLQWIILTASNETIIKIEIFTSFSDRLPLILFLQTNSSVFYVKNISSDGRIFNVNYQRENNTAAIFMFHVKVSQSASYFCVATFSNAGILSIEQQTIRLIVRSNEDDSDWKQTIIIIGIFAIFIFVILGIWWLVRWKRNSMLQRINNITKGVERRRDLVIANQNAVT